VLDEFEEIVCCDFEFNGRDGNRPNVVCLVAYELRSGRRFRLWRDQMGTCPPYRIDDKTLFVAYYASAELQCHLVLGWPMPRHVLDLFAEFRCLTNTSDERQPDHGLLDAMEQFRLDCIDARTKQHWRNIVLRGAPFTAEEIAGILDYCESDVDCLERLLPVIPISNLRFSLLRGSYMRADALMCHRGIPIDKPLFDSMSEYWPEIRQGIINDLNTKYPFFEGPVFKKKRLEEWVAQQGIGQWPRTPTGQLCTDRDTLRMIGDRCPAATEFCAAKVTLDQLKTFKLAVGDDGRNRCMLSAFEAKTGRNLPSNSRYVFGLNAAFRSLIRPEPGSALVYLDFSAQEFALAAYFSNDAQMIAAYESGDPYSAWARAAGEMPPEGNKHTHPIVRAIFKRAALGVLYTMGATTLAEYLGTSELRAKSLLQSHKQAFPDYWRWSERVQDAGVSRRWLATVFDWRMQIGRHARGGTLANYPMQANGAEMLRLACCLAGERGIHLVAPVHDAIMVEGPEADIEIISREMKHCMMEASRLVLGGPVVRVDASRPLIYPHRYVDGRNVVLWDRTLELLARITNRKAISDERQSICGHRGSACHGGEASVEQKTASAITGGTPARVSVRQC
jgi:DNA polymerase family A